MPKYAETTIATNKNSIRIKRTCQSAQRCQSTWRLSICAIAPLSNNIFMILFVFVIKFVFANCQKFQMKMTYTSRRGQALPPSPVM